MPDMAYASACAFIERSANDRKEALAHTGADVSFAVSFEGEETTIRVSFSNACNGKLRELLGEVQVPQGLKLKVALE